MVKTNFRTLAMKFPTRKNWRPGMMNGAHSKLSANYVKQKAPASSTMMTSKKYVPPKLFEIISV